MTIRKPVPCSVTKPVGFIAAAVVTQSRFRRRLAGLTVLAMLATAGCKFMDVRRQDAIASETCIIEGTVLSQRSSANPLVVVLAQDAQGAGQPARPPWKIVDHWVATNKGRWAFAVPTGRYAIAAFEDVNADAGYQAGEPYAGVDLQRVVLCEGGSRFKGLRVSLPRTGADANARELDIEQLQVRSRAEQIERSLAQLTIVGDVTTLDDARVSPQDPTVGLWKPLDYMVSSPPGIYFLQPYSPEKTPVLFVHGINGSAADFRYLIENLDTDLFQPWVYIYPSGGYLKSIADHLDRTMAQLERQYGVRNYVVVAHSMGGLVARGFLLRHASAKRAARIPLFVSISTPWGGHEGARAGVRYAPVVANVWNDMVPDSDYLRSLYEDSLLPETHHHLFFTYRRDGVSLGACSDETVTVKSQLDPHAQAGAVESYGFDDTHAGVLRSADAMMRLNATLAGQRQFGSPALAVTAD